MNLWKISKILAVVGIALSVYLLYSQIYQPAFQPCYVNSWINCEAVISGAVKNTLGIPTPLYGLVGYIIILFSIFKKNKKLFFGMSLFGTLFCLRITYIEVFIIKTLCPVCLLCQIVMLSLLAISSNILLIKKAK